jgi:hypothetical protein
LHQKEQPKKRIILESVESEEEKSEESMSTVQGGLPSINK